VLVLVEGEASRTVEHARTTPPDTPLAKEAPLRVKYGNTMQGFIGDVDVAFSVDRDRRRPHQLAVFGTTAAEFA
jgi:hypothetical protein